MPNGFEKACPSGNIMVEQEDNSQKIECERCEGKGYLNITDFKEHKLKRIDCPDCDGQGFYYD